MTPETPRIARLAWIPTVAWMAVIFALSSIPDPGVPSGFATPGHAGLYAVLGALLALALAPDRDAYRIVALAVLIGSAYGLSDEVHQAFVPGRMPDIVDWAVDTVGTFAGATALVWVRSLLLSRR